MIRVAINENEAVDYAGIIYIIIEDMDNGNINIKYVGRTTQITQKRLNRHLNDSTSKLGCYIRINRDEIKHWRIIELLVLKKTHLDDIEKYLIGKLKPLFNTSLVNSNDYYLYETNTIETLNEEIKSLKSYYKCSMFVSKLADKLPKKRGLNGIARQNLINRIDAAIEELRIIKAELEAIEDNYTVFKSRKSGNVIWIPE